MLEHWNDGIVAGFLIPNEYLKVRWADDSKVKRISQFKPCQF